MLRPQPVPHRLAHWGGDARDGGRLQGQAPGASPWDLPQDLFLERYLQAALNEHPLSQHHLQQYTHSAGDGHAAPWDARPGPGPDDLPEADPAIRIRDYDAHPARGVQDFGNYDAGLLDSCSNPLFDSNASDILMPGGSEVLPPGHNEGAFTGHKGHNRQNADGLATQHALAQGMSPNPSNSRASSGLDIQLGVLRAGPLGESQALAQPSSASSSFDYHLDGLRADAGAWEGGWGGQDNTRSSSTHLPRPSVCSTAETFTRVSVGASTVDLMDQQHAARIAELRHYIQLAGGASQADMEARLDFKALEQLASDTASAAAAVEAAGAAAAVEDPDWIIRSGVDRIMVSTAYSCSCANFHAGGGGGAHQHW